MTHDVGNNGAGNNDAGNNGAGKAAAVKNAAMLAMSSATFMTVLTTVLAAGHKFGP